MKRAPVEALQPWHLGEFEGKEPDDAVHQGIDYYIEHPDEVPPGKGADDKLAESFNAAKSRQLTFLRDVYADFEAKPESRIGVVMHSRGMELLQSWVDAGCPEDFEVDHDEMENAGDPEHTSMLRWDADGIEEVDAEDDAPLKPGVYLILHGLTDDDSDAGNADELEKIEVQKYLPPIEVHRAAKSAWDLGTSVIDITFPLAEGEGLTAEMVAKIANHFSGTEHLTEPPTTRDAWGGPLAAKWAERVAKKAEKDQVEKGGSGSGRYPKGSGGGSNYTAPSREDQDKAVGQIKDQMKMISDLQGGRGTDAFVLEHGQSFNITDKSFDGPRGEQKLCYMNASQAALNDSKLTYVEGQVHIGPLAIAHAWTVDKEGNVVDPTLKATSPESSVSPRGYFGVPFKTEYLMETMVKTGVYGVISHTNPSLFSKAESEFRSTTFKKYDVSKGGVGSGNFGHSGRVGERGGSGRAGGPTPANLKPGQSTEDFFRDPVTKVWEGEREAWHKSVTSALLAGKVPNGGTPVAYITGGGMASGKGSLGETLGSVKANLVHIDPDQMKEKIPELAGLKISDPSMGASRVHEESSYMSKQVLAGAIANKLDLYYDSSGSGKNTNAMVHTLTSEGYQVHVLFADVPKEIAVERADSRAEKTGRAVPYDILSASHTGAAINFGILANSPDVSSAKLYSTVGKSPSLVYSREGSDVAKVHDPAFWNYYKGKGLN